MEELLSDIYSAIKTLVSVPKDTWRTFYSIFFYPWRFFNNLPLSSYTGYLASSIVLIATIITPRMPIGDLSESEKSPIKKVIFHKIFKFTTRFVFKWAFLYITLLYGIILYVLFLPFAYPISWKIHFHGLVFIFSTLSIFYCIILLFDRIFYRLYGKQSILHYITIMFGEFEKERTRRIRNKRTAADDGATKHTVKSNGDKKSIHIHLINFLRLSKVRAKKGPDQALHIFKESSLLQKIILRALLLYGFVFTIAALIWLHV